MEDIINKAIEKDRQMRYQSAAEIRTDLQRLKREASSGVVSATRAASGSRATAGVISPPQPRMKSAYLKWTVALAVLAVFAGGGMLLCQKLIARPPVKHGPVSVLIADFTNETADPIFDGTLEPMLGVALEGASFVSLYNRGQARKVTAQLQPGASVLDDRMGRLVAMREGVSVVVGGSVARDGSSYRVSVNAMDAATGKSIAHATGTAGKTDILLQMGTLAASIRKALGDATPESLQLAAAETYTTRSLDAAHEYALAQTAQFAGNWNDTIQHCQKALQYDPELGRAYVVIAVMYNNLKQSQESEKYFQMALSRLDSMSDREKYRTRGAYYLVARKPDKALEELQQFVSRYPADSAGIGNLALAHFYLRDMAQAREVGRREVEIYPKNVVVRNNMALYAMYASDFDTSLREQRTVLEMNPSFALGYIGTALSQLALGYPDQASDTYRQLEKRGPDGVSAAAAGLADIALYQGRTPEAIKILVAGIAGDLANKNPDGAATKQAAISRAHLAAGKPAEAVRAAERALALSHRDPIRFWAAQAYIAAGQEAKAQAIARELGSGLEADPQAYGKLIEGETQLKRGKPREALKLFLESRKLADTWMGRFDAGRAYVAAGAFAEAGSELEVCLKRRGEATALFLDESPTYHLFPPVYYYLGQAQEGLKSPAAHESYKTFISIKNGGQDPLLADARRRFEPL